MKGFSVRIQLHHFIGDNVRLILGNVIALDFRMRRYCNEDAGDRTWIITIMTNESLVGRAVSNY